MRPPSDPERVGINAIGRGLVGTALVSQSARIGTRVDAANTFDLTRALTWVLGVRHLAEAALLTGCPLPAVRRVVTVVDVVHTASMCAIAIGSPRYRKTAGAAVALAFGVTALGLVKKTSAE